MSPIKFATKCIFPNFHILKINRMMWFCDLLMKWPSCWFVYTFTFDFLSLQVFDITPWRLMTMMMIHFILFLYFIISSFIFIVPFVLGAFCHLFNKRILDWIMMTKRSWLTKARKQADSIAASIDSVAHKRRQIHSTITESAYPSLYAVLAA